MKLKPHLWSHSSLNTCGGRVCALCGECEVHMQQTWCWDNTFDFSPTGG